MIWGQTLLDLFQKGSFVMWPLLGASIIGLAIIVERGLYYFLLRFNYEHFTINLKGHLMNGSVEDARNFCEKRKHPVAHMAAVYLRHLHHDDVRANIVKREGSLALEKVEARLRGLATVAHLAPLLGLLGTVTGLVTAFHQIELLGGQVQPADLAGGIWSALLTTVFGLLVAIPCLGMYHGFEGFVDRISRRMQFIVSELDEYFGKAPEGSTERNEKNTHSDIESIAVR